MLHDLHVAVVALFGPGTWGAGGNLVAWVLCGVIAAVFAALRRDWVGRHLAAWWSRHRREHEIEHHLEALRRHEAEKRKAGEP